MTNELSTNLADYQVALGATATDEALSNVTKVSDYLPRVQLYGATSEAAKEGKIGMGRFGLARNKNSLVDLTNEFICVIFSWRPKAMIYAPQIVAYYDHLSEDFKKIQATADVKDAQRGFGPEFLLWLPEHKEFATYFMANKTARAEAANVKQFIGKPATFKSTLIKTSKYSWHGPVCQACNVPISVLPPKDLYDEVVYKFCNPPSTQVEQAESDTNQRAR